MRLIDADELRNDWLQNGQNENVYDTNAFLESIDNAPTVDAEPVRHGKWILNKKKHTWECSECNQTGSSLEETKSNYCKNCGAKMDGE